MLSASAKLKGHLCWVEFIIAARVCIYLNHMSLSCIYYCIMVIKLFILSLHENTRVDFYQILIMKNYFIVVFFLTKES